MDLEKLQFAISNSSELPESEKDAILVMYKKLFAQIYGYDIISSYLKNMEATPKKRKFKTFKDSYVDSIDVFGSVERNKNLALLLIYNEEKILIGAGRLKEINEYSASIPDIAIGFGTEEEKREIWKKTLMFVEGYFTDLGYEKMYVEVPFKEPNLLIRADDLGFTEHPDDISIWGEARTYLLNKSLVRNKNEEQDISRK